MKVPLLTESGMAVVRSRAGYSQEFERRGAAIETSLGPASSAHEGSVRVKGRSSMGWLRRRQVLYGLGRIGDKVAESRPPEDGRFKDVACQCTVSIQLHAPERSGVLLICRQFAFMKNIVLCYSSYLSVFSSGCIVRVAAPSTCNIAGSSSWKRSQQSRRRPDSSGDRPTYRWRR